MWKRDTSEKAQSPEQPPRTDPQPMSPRAPQTVSDHVGVSLGRSIVINGELSASENLTLTGQMDGSIRLASHTLTIGEEATIRANIDAAAVVILGALTGDVTASQRVEIGPTGSVIGDITSPRLSIADGGSIRGKVETPNQK